MLTIGMLGGMSWESSAHIVPGQNDRAEVHRIIYDELCLGDVRDASRQTYRKIIDRLVRSGAQGVILGCTEIELLVSPADSPVPVFPTSRLHVEAAVNAALRDGTLIRGVSAA